MSEFPTGTLLKLDLPPLDEAAAARAGLPAGSPDPWGLIRVHGAHDAGGDKGGISLVCAPVVFSAISSPKAFDPSVLLDDLGYRIADPEEELTHDDGGMPEYGQPGYWGAVSRRDREARRVQREQEEA